MTTCCLCGFENDEEETQNSLEIFELIQFYLPFTLNVNKILIKNNPVVNRVKKQLLSQSSSYLIN